MVRGLRTLGWVMVVALCCGGAIAAEPKAKAKPAATEAAASTVAFTSQVQLGNIFTVGEKPAIEADVHAGNTADWYVTDFEGAKLASGMATVTDGKIRIEPPDLGKGYFSVFVTAKDGTESKGEGRTAYAVVPAFDIASMADSKFGIMTHFAQNMPVDMLPLMAKAGVAHIRDEQYWNGVEKKKGEFVFPDMFQNYMDLAKKLQIAPLICMSFGNPIYDNQKGVPAYKLAPWNPQTNEAYANYCVQVLKHYGDQIKAAEIWNEYNGTFCDGKAKDNRPKFYTEMLKVAYEKIKAARPEVEVLGGACVKIPLPYIEKLFKEGALKYMDAVAVHPYMSADETEDALACLVDMMKKYNQGKAKGIWCTEYGWWQDKSVERPEAAQHLVRMTTAMLTQDKVERVFWYLSRDYAPTFASMGIVHDQKDPQGPLTPVMTYPAYANLISLLYQAQFRAHVKTDVRTRLYEFAQRDRQVWIAWSVFENATFQLKANGPVTMVNVVGSEKRLTPENGTIAVTVGEMPVYLVASDGTVSSIAEGPRKDSVIADSESEFAGPQVKNAWSYWYIGNDKKGSLAYDMDKLRPMSWEPSPGDWADTWSGPGKWYTVSAGGAAPSAIEGGQGWSVRRWTSTVDGPVHILAKLTTNTQGDGCGFKVFIDGKEVYSKLLGPKMKETVDLQPTVQKGTRIDFVVTPGPGTDANYDNGGFRVQVLTPVAQ